MSYDDHRKSISDAGESLRKVQEEISNLSFDDSTRRDRVTALLNNVSERLVAVHDELVSADEKDQDVRSSDEAIASREVRESDSEKAHNRPIAEDNKDRSVKDAPRPGSKR
jgi:hypothetical protein